MGLILPENADTIPAPFTSDDPGYIFLDAKTSRHKNRYLLTPQPATIDGKTPLLFPYCDDSEYWHRLWAQVLASAEPFRRRVVTYQIQHIVIPRPHVLVHPDFVQYARQAKITLRHPTLSSGFGPYDYLQYLIACYPQFDLSVSLDRHTDQWSHYHLPSCVFLEYGYFILVDQYPQLLENFLLDYDYLVRHGGVKMGKRIKAQWKQFEDTCPTRWILTINGMPYRIDLCKADLGAIQGHLSLEQVAQNVGLIMQEKTFMHTNKRIEHMMEVYGTYPTEYDRYVVVDVDTPYRMFHNFAHFLRRIYRALDLEDYYMGESKLTIGATDIQLFKAALYKHCGIAAKDTKAQTTLINNFCLFGSSWYFSRQMSTTARLATKCFGGRCYNPRPTFIRGFGAFADIDSKGAYARSQQQQLYALGVPLVIDNKVSNRRIRRQTLRQFLDTWKGKLVPGLWYAVVSTEKDYELTFGQDILPSWIDPGYRNQRQSVPAGMIDLQQDDFELDPHTGHVKILSHQLLNAPVTHDYVQMLYAVMSKAQRNELLDHLLIEVAVLYPANKRVNSIEELYARYREYDGESFAEVDADKVIKTYQEDDGYFWYGVNLGDLLITDLLKQRYDYAPKTPMNELFKLCINTLFGDLVSPYFTTSNVVVANNITARTRCMIWYAEKALYAFQSITDGGILDLNQVPVSRDNRKVTASMISLLMDAKDLQGERRLDLRPLGGYHQFEVIKDGSTTSLRVYTTATAYDTYPEETAKALINRLAMEQVQKLFPGDIDILRHGQFEFETKHFFKKITLHGAANYCGDDDIISMRSYEKKEHYTANLNGETLEIGDFYEHTTPAKYFHIKGLGVDPTSIPRSYPFVKTAILKLAKYCQIFLPDHGQIPTIQPGQTILVTGMLREFSPSQYTYRTVAQFQAILKQWQKLKNKFEQSYELYFLDNGRLRYEEMTLTLHRLIRNGCQDLISALDPHYNQHRSTPTEHPYLTLLRHLKNHIKTVFLAQQPLVDDEDLFGDDIEDTESFRCRAED